ncbi:WxL domain-containing protein [Enterococcus sp. LJL99]
MKKKSLTLFSSMVFTMLTVCFPVNVLAQTGKGTVDIEANYAQQVVDPENPQNNVDPGESPKTSGDLRIDFVPQLNFGSNKLSTKDEVYFGNAQLFHGETGARGNFVQVSDYRGTGSGWLLQVKQETQFKNESAKNKELKGAVISFDQSWTNSVRSANQAPIVSKDIVRIDHIGETYNLAEAKQGTGEGTWSIVFGASIQNKNDRKNTLSPRMKPTGEPELDPVFENKPIYKNEALSLAVPGNTKKDAVNYQTVITWILSELP